MAIDLQTIWELLQDVNVKCDDLLTFKDVHLEAHKGIDEKLQNCRQTLYDSRNGLTYKVEKLLQCKNNFKTNRDYWRSFWFGLLRVVSAAAIIGLTAWLLSLYKGN